MIKRLATSALGIQSKFYLEFQGTLPEATAVSLVFLSKLSKSQLESSLEIFRQNLFPKIERAAIPVKISEHFQESLYTSFSNSVHPIGKKYETLLKRLEHLTPYIKRGEELELTPARISEAIKVLVEFCDRGNIGFLSGDLSVDLFEVMMKHISFIEVDSLNANQEIFEKIEEFLLEGEFAMPKYGIPFASEENPRGLFIREIMVEKDSAEIIMGNTKHELEALTHKAFGINYLTQKEQLLILFLPFLKEITIYEEKLVQMGDSENLLVFFIELNCSADKLAVVTLNTIARMSLPLLKDSINYIEILFTKAVLNVGKDIQKQILQDKQSALFEEFKKSRKLEKKDPITDEKLLRKLLKNELKHLNEEYQYTNESIVESGAALMKLLISSSSTKDSEGLITQPITHSIKKERGKTIGILVILKPFLKKLMGKVSESPSDANNIFLERTLPMICTPCKWTDWETGGYIQKGYPIMRFQSSRLQKSSLERADLSEICEALNIMGETPWKINSKILEVVEEVFAQGGGLGEIPIVDTGNEFIPNSSQSYMQRKKLEKEQRDNWSLLSDFELKLGIARSFNKIEYFFMPLNLDFRGRIYPISPHLNEIGNDLSRGLLEFAQAKPLGAEGLRWLKIHLANKMGHDKLPIEDREKIIEKNLSFIKTIAEDPLKNKEWLSFEDPWESLATIFELTEALNQKTPEDFLSKIHIHQDGSCNGLQHYAALGRDIEGAFEVNLTDRDRPGDLYTAISKRVQEMVDEDASKGELLALKLVGKIKRKIVKQTVMTSVYGVTYIGARDQIQRQLKDHKLLEDEELPLGAAYIAKHTMSALNDFFKGAERIKDWFIDCARTISCRGHPVTWVTPLGLPVIQPYRRGTSSIYVDTVFQRVKLMSSKDNLPVSVAKEKSAFPPNYVHSLDSSHLMLTAIECKKQGLEFAAVHDSFWTHASDIPKMNEILREEFVYLHSEPLLEELLEGFRRRFPKAKFEDVPERGNFDLNEILKSTYFFA